MLNKNELDMADIYSAPEITHKVTHTIISFPEVPNICISSNKIQNATNLNCINTNSAKNVSKHRSRYHHFHHLPECLSTDCSSESEDELDEEMHSSPSSKRDIFIKTDFNLFTVSLHPHQCLKPSLFNP